MAYLLKVDVYKIYLYPLGGISKFNMDQNISIIKEFLILIMGPIFQVIAYFLLQSFLPRYIDMIKLYHFGILLFNLLPIFPLDGGKLVNLFLSGFFSFRSSYYLSIFISYLFIILIFIFNKLNLNLLLVVILLFFKVTKEYKNFSYLYEKFLLERLLKEYNFKDTKIINNSKNFYRNKKHLLNINDKYIWEKEFLNKMFKNC